MSEDALTQADDSYRQLLSDGTATPEDVLAYIQRHIVVPKGKRNTFADFDYRSLGDIHDALDPLLVEQMCSVTYEEDLEAMGQYVYVVSTCTLHTPYGTVSAKSPARDAIQKKKSDAPQITGMAITYARKYAAGGLFRLDTERDPDSEPPEEEPEYPEGEFYAQCRSCGQIYGPMNKHMALASYCGTCHIKDWKVMPEGWQPGPED